MRQKPLHLFRFKIQFGAIEHCHLYLIYLLRMLTFHCYVSLPKASRGSVSICFLPIVSRTRERRFPAPWTSHSAEESLGYHYDAESPGFYEVAETTLGEPHGLVAFVDAVIEVR